MRRTPLRQRSARLAALMRVYTGKRKAFLECFPNCIRCGCRAEEVHHAAGRIGDLLLAEEHWRAVCHECHVWITSHPAEAYEQGYSLRRVAS